MARLDGAVAADDGHGGLGGARASAREARGAVGEVLRGLRRGHPSLSTACAESKRLGSRTQQRELER